MRFRHFRKARGVPLPETWGNRGVAHVTVPMEAETLPSWNGVYFKCPGHRVIVLDLVPGGGVIQGHAEGCEGCRRDLPVEIVFQMGMNRN